MSCSLMIKQSSSSSRLDQWRLEPSVAVAAVWKLRTLKVSRQAAVQGLQVAGAARCGRSFLTARRGCPLPTACRARSPKLPAAAACRFAEAAALRGHPLHTTCPRRYLPMRSARAAARRPERSRVTALLRLYNGLSWRRPRESPMFGVGN
jgi:hypothetical protein